MREYGRLLSIILVLGVLITLPSTASAATYYGQVINPNSTIYTTLSATPGTNSGIIRCHGENWNIWAGVYNGYAAIYKTTYIYTTGTLRIGIEWNIDGFLAAWGFPFFTGLAKWELYYFITEPGNELNPYAKGAWASVANDHIEGTFWLWFSKTTQDSRSASTYYITNRAIQGGKYYSVGLCIYFRIQFQSYISGDSYHNSPLTCSIGTINMQYAS